MTAVDFVLQLATAGQLSKLGTKSRLLTREHVTFVEFAKRYAINKQFAACILLSQLKTPDLNCILA